MVFSEAAGVALGEGGGLGHDQTHFFEDGSLDGGGGLKRAQNKGGLRKTELIFSSTENFLWET